LLRDGDSGPAVVALQQRLSSLGYWLGSADGKYGDATRQAVVAFQKIAGLDRDGVVGPRTAAALKVATTPQARPAQSRTVEIDLRRQVLFVVSGGRVTWAFNTSTGGGYVYYHDGQRHVAVTPTGVFEVTRQVDGWDHSPLGWLWRPKYFNGGVAVHGYEEVPAYPASHGCVRVGIDAMNWLWTAIPVGTPVIVY
jgi:lipoprotein-anchoring transpeptidase ErfK/SrfK